MKTISDFQQKYPKIFIEENENYHNEQEILMQVLGFLSNIQETNDLSTINDFKEMISNYKDIRKNAIN